MIAVENQFTEYQRSFKKFRERLDRQAMPRLLFAVRLVVKDSERITLPVSRATLHSARIANSCLQIYSALEGFAVLSAKLRAARNP